MWLGNDYKYRQNKVKKKKEKFKLGENYSGEKYGRRTKVQIVKNCIS